MNYREHIEFNPNILPGKPVIKGTRIGVDLISQKLSEGATHQQLLEAYPSLTVENILAALAYTSEIISNETVIA